MRTGAAVAVRETRRIVGDYVHTVEDAQEGIEFEDVVARKYGAIDSTNLMAPMKSGCAYPYDGDRPGGGRGGGAVQRPGRDAQRVGRPGVAGCPALDGCQTPALEPEVVGGGRTGTATADLPSPSDASGRRYYYTKGEACYSSCHICRSTQ